MNRRQAITTTFGAMAAGVLTDRLVGQAEVRKQSSIAGNMLYLNPSTGSDANAGAKESPLRSLAEAARRVNQSTW